MRGLDRNKIAKFHKGELKFVQVFGLDADQIASVLVSGHNFFCEGRLEEAKNIFEGLAVLDPKNPYVHSMLGAVYQRMQQYEPAIFCYTTALEIFPSDISALTNRGEIYLNLGRFEEAANDLKKAIELDPEKKHPSANRARLLATMAAESLRLVKEKRFSALASH